MDSIDTAPDRYAVAGFPVAHSRSPAIHAQFAQATGQRLSYGRLEVEPGSFAERIRAFAAAGGRGCNVTVPYKFEAHELALRRTPRAALAQAVNTLRFDPTEAGGWWGDNTDGAGLVRDIEHNAGVALRGQRLLLIGAGGAAAGAMGPLIETGLAELVLCNRTVAKAEAIVQRHAALADAHGVRLRATGLADCGRAFDGVVNATSSSLSGAASPVGAEVLRAGSLALDMMYGPAARPFLAWAREHGAVGRDGLGMLVEQAAEAFAAWRGVRPETAAVMATIRAELDAA
ncbi:MAG: shikimate dehydrogenase [Leptothrix sp. (in: b-proteobacteria)]